MKSSKETLPLIGNELIWSLSLSVVFMNYCYVSEYYILLWQLLITFPHWYTLSLRDRQPPLEWLSGQALGGNLLEQAKRESKNDQNKEWSAWCSSYQLPRLPFVHSPGYMKQFVYWLYSRAHWWWYAKGVYHILSWWWWFVYLLWSIID